MPAYVPNATQTTEPVESRTVESAALEFRTLKSSINSRIADLEAKDDLLDAEDAALQAEIDAVEVRTLALEQLAFNGSTPGTVVVQRFVTDAIETAFTLDVTPVTVAAVDAYINGVYQNHDTFSVSGNVVTFSEAPAAGILELQVSVPLQIGVTTADAVEYTPAGTGAVATTVQSKLRETVSVKDFGADNTGATNATTALLNFFTYCIATGTPGHIPAGDYLVTAGVLAFDNGFTNKIWPNISTDGYGAVTFKRADATNAPFISITNGTATSGVDMTWKGGSLGGITFDQNGKAAAAGQHAIVLRGLVGTKFGYMRANNQGGSCVLIERKLYGGSNPDPYNVANCYFDGVEANFCGGAAFYNDNYVGFAGCTINYVRAIENQNGAFYGFGAGNRINVMSVGSCASWALGNPTDVTGGESTRFSLGIAEFDDVQYGIDLRAVSSSDFGTVRFVHRYNFGPYNPAGGYWPRIAVQCAATRSVLMNKLRIIDRIEAGGLKANLGQFFDFGSSGAQLIDVYVQRHTIDNAGFGLVLSDYYTNFNANTKVLYTDFSGNPIIDTLKKTALIARAPTTFAVPSGGFTGGANTVQYSTELSDSSESYNPATWTYTCRSPGQYRVVARIVLAVAIGTRIRMAIMQNGSAVLGRYFYATTTNAQCYEIGGEFDVSAGATFNINADQNTGGAVNLTTMLSVNENTFFVTQI